MLVMTAIPGQTGCLAVRNVPKPTRRKFVISASAKKPKKKNTSVVTPPLKARHYELRNGTPQHSGGQREKVFLHWQQDRRDNRPEQNLRAQNAKQHSRLIRGDDGRLAHFSRDSIRKHVQPEEPRQSSLMDLLDELLD